MEPIERPTAGMGSSETSDTSSLPGLAAPNVPPGDPSPAVGPIVYRIRDWSTHFENNRTKEMKDMRWVPVPNKHDGDGFRTIMAHPKGIIIYGCWHLILQVASKSHPRGTLLRSNRTPHTAQSIALKCGWNNIRDIQMALDFCASSEVDWIERLTEDMTPIPQEGAVNPQAPARKEWNRMEGNGRNGIPPGGRPQVDELHPVKRRIGSWFGRRESTPWSEKELKALRSLGNPPPEIDLVESYYKHTFPSNEDYRRRDIQTLLNNWLGEVDRANRWKTSAPPVNRFERPKIVSRLGGTVK